MKRKSKERRKRNGIPPSDRALLTPIIAGLFEELNVGAAVHTGATADVFEEWYPLHAGPGPVAFEFEHGKDVARWKHNEDGMAQARREGKPVFRELAGFFDAFVPLGAHDDAPVALVVGPFARSRPESGDVLARWREITGSHGRLGDPVFASYLSTTLAMLTLEGALFEDFKRLLGVFAQLRHPSASAEKLAQEVQILRPRLATARSAEQMWVGASSMVDDRTARGWVRADRTGELARLGVKRPPEDVVVGLLLGADDQTDPIHDMLRRDTFQRACVELARKDGGLVCARIGDHGVALLVEHSSISRARLIDVAERTAKLARRFELKLHAGVSPKDARAPAASRYHAALGAAEQALMQDVRLVHAVANPNLGPSPLGALRRELGRTVGQHPNQLSARFQRYAEAAAAHSGYRLEAVRAQLEAGFDEIVDALVAADALDGRTLAEVRQTIDHDAANAESVSDLSMVYRRLVADTEHALLQPRDARQERSFRRALSYMRDHLAEPLSRSKVARIAGFSEHYFSKRFAESEGVTFQHYLRKLRLDRAKHMVRYTTLSIERVAELSGFGDRVQFHRAFKQALGVTPQEFRRRPLREIESE